MLKIVNWQDLSSEAQWELLKRPVSANPQIQNKVRSIIEAVKMRGDQALFELTREFDSIELTSLQVPTENIQKAKVSPEILNAINMAIANLRTYHQATKPQNRMVNTADGVSVEQMYRPIDKIGLYVPGGNNTPLISSLLMQAIPAEIAGCPIKILCTPPNSSGEIDPALLVAARLCNIETVYRIGGAQAIAAMAYGTESITKVNKLFGPGNAYVTEAKSQVAFDPLGAAIDLPAGPSEVMIMADSAANPQFIAADLLAQAEHGPDSQVFLVCDNLDLADNVRLEVREQAGKAKRKSIIVQALENGAIILCDNHEDQLKIINSYAPEHLIINRTDAHDWVANITSAGSIFVGPWAAETMGDYITGSNHVLPTYGHAKAYSGLSCRDFLKCISVQSIKASGITALGPSAVVLANLEGLEAHAHAVQIRLQALLEDKL